MSKKEPLEKDIKPEDIMQEETTTIQVARSLEQESVVYVGPTIQNIVVANTVFNNGITEVLKNKCDTLPTLATMIKPLSEYSQALAELRDSTSALSLLYKKIEEELENGRI